MSELIPSYTITEFRSLKVPQLKRLKSCEIFSDGEYLFTFIRPNTDYIKLSVENLGQLSNSVRGEELDDILGLVKAGVDNG